MIFKNPRPTTRIIERMKQSTEGKKRVLTDERETGNRAQVDLQDEAQGRTGNRRAGKRERRGGIKERERDDSVARAHGARGFVREPTDDAAGS